MQIHFYYGSKYKFKPYISNDKGEVISLNLWKKLTQKTALKQAVYFLVFLFVIGITAAIAIFIYIESNCIGSDTAVKLAIIAADMDGIKVKNEESHLVLVNNKLVYAVSFEVGGKKYCYYLRAETGEVLNNTIEQYVAPSSTEPVTTGSTYPSTEASPIPSNVLFTISAEEAKNIALIDSGISKDSAVFSVDKINKSQTSEIINIIFTASEKEYYYEIDLSTGKIINKSQKSILENSDSQKPHLGNYIGVDEAKRIAVTRAGLEIESVQFTRAKFEESDHINVYKLEFHYEKFDYEYTINAFNGEIIEYDIDD